jgi:hypothetical protein
MSSTDSSTPNTLLAVQAERLWKRHLEQDDSPVTDFFGGQLQNNVTCHVCKHRFTSYEFFKVAGGRASLHRPLAFLSSRPSPAQGDTCSVIPVLECTALSAFDVACHRKCHQIISAAGTQAATVCKP